MRFHFSDVNLHVYIYSLSRARALSLSLPLTHTHTHTHTHAYQRRPLIEYNMDEETEEEGEYLQEDMLSLWMS